MKFVATQPQVPWSRRVSNAVSPVESGANVPGAAEEEEEKDAADSQARTHTRSLSCTQGAGKDRRREDAGDGQGEAGWVTETEILEWNIMNITGRAHGEGERRHGDERDNETSLDVLTGLLAVFAPHWQARSPSGGGGEELFLILLNFPSQSYITWSLMCDFFLNSCFYWAERHRV